MRAEIKIGTQVVTTMGVSREGCVIRPIRPEEYSDGSYRRPESHESAVYVEWSDGTRGWSHTVHIKEKAEPKPGCDCGRGEYDENGVCEHCEKEERDD